MVHWSWYKQRKFCWHTVHWSFHFHIFFPCILDVLCLFWEFPVLVYVVSSWCCCTWCLQVWTVSSGFCFVTFSEHTNAVTALHFMASNHCLLSASLDGTVRAWDLFRYRNFRTFTTPSSKQFVSLASDQSGEVICAGTLDSFEVRFYFQMDFGIVSYNSLVWLMVILHVCVSDFCLVDEDRTTVGCS